MEQASGLTWREAQDALRDCENEEQVQQLIDAELAGPNRMRWLNRMRGRFKVLREEREQRELDDAFNKAKES